MRSVPETTELRASGAISVSSHGGWRLGWLSLGNAMLTFRHRGTRGVVQIDLRSVSRLDVERRKFVLVGKRVVRLTYRPSRATHPRSCWVITAQLGDWEAALRRRVGLLREREGPLAVQSRLPVPHDLTAGLAGLSSTAGLVLDYLAHRGYATTAELVALIGADTEESLLFHLHEGFRRIEPTLGGPAIRYEGVCFDRRSGEPRQQSWWVDEMLAESWLASRVPTDVLLEDDELVVVMSMPTQARGALPSTHVDSQGRGLVVHGARGYERWIALPEEVVGDTQCAMSTTGTLVIRARRRRPGTTHEQTGGSPRRGLAVSLPAGSPDDRRQIEE